MHVIILEPLSSGAALVKAAWQMGLAPVVFTANQGERRLPAECRPYVASVITVDTYDAEAVFGAAQALLRETSIGGVVPGWEYCVGVAAETASRLGLPHLPQATATAARNKFICRERLQAAGVDVPRYALVQTRADVEHAARRVGFPAVFKPTDGGGSMLVQRVNSLTELQQAFDHAAGGVFDVEHFVGTSFLLEEFLEGREFSIEGYVDRSEPRVVAVTEKRLGQAPFFVEMGHAVEATISPQERDAMVDYIERVARAIGLNLGAFHAEARITPRGPILIEINCRLGGDRIVRLVELAKGISLPAAMVRSYCRLPIPRDSISLQERHGAAGVRFLSMGTGSTMGRVLGLDEVSAMPGCVEVSTYFTLGDAVPPLTDCRGRVGHILFQAESRQALDRLLRQAEERITIESA